MTSTETINAVLWQQWNQSADVALSMRIRRLLVTTYGSEQAQNNALGVNLPRPFDSTSLAIRTKIGETSRAVTIAASRLTSNSPEVSVIPLSTSSDIGVTTDKMAGMQERADGQMLQEAGLPDSHWEAAWAKSVTGAAFWVVMPRDADFGLPDRSYYDESDEEIARLRADGKIGQPKVNQQTGRLTYAEHGDVWANRRKNAAKMRAISGRSLFTLRVYPRDMVLKEKDAEARDLKWAAMVEEIPSSAVGPGSDFGLAMARKLGIPSDDQGLWGVFWDEKGRKIVGGIPRGGPQNSTINANDAFTLIRWFDREDYVILVAPRGSVQGATEIWRGKHQCMVQGQPACPVVEDAFYHTDVNVPGKEYATPLDAVFSYVPIVNQLMTLESNVAAYNGIPRFVVELNPRQDGANTIRAEDGTPMTSAQSVTPGLDPEDMAAYPGQVKQLVINDESLLEALKIYFERLDAVMPSMGTDASGADAAAWAVQMRIQESQQPYQRGVTNSCQALSGVVQRCHGWLRQLDVPVYFFAAPGHRGKYRDIHGLIEIDPKDITDSIVVTQSLDTPAEATVRAQIGTQLWQLQLIDDEELADKYLHEQDARDFVVRRWVQIIMNYVMQGVVPIPPPGTQPGSPSLVQIVGDAVRGAVMYGLIQQNDNAAWAVADNMAKGAQQQLAGAQPGMPPQQPQGQTQMGGAPTGSPNGAQPSSLQGAMVQPGAGMAPTLDGTLGSAVPGGNVPPPPAMAGGFQ